MTKVHNDHIQIDSEDFGYSIRVGKTLPSDSVNLAYVHTNEVVPSKNLLITDYSNQILNNTMLEVDTASVYPDNNFLLRKLNQPLYSITRNLVVTDEFSIPSTVQDQITPLYYRCNVKGLFDAKGSIVDYYVTGYTSSPTNTQVDYSQVNPALSGSLLYLGNKIRITMLDGTPLSPDQKYKVLLLKQTGVGIPADAYSIVIYTNFNSTGNAFQVRYEKYNLDGTHLSDFIEILNAYPFFTEVDKSTLDTLAQSPKAGSVWNPNLLNKQFAVDETTDKRWQVYAPSQVLIADNLTRPAHQFSYRIKANLRTKLSSSQPGSLNIGIIYVNQNVFTGEDLTGVVKKINEHPLKPPYLSLNNPHNAYIGHTIWESMTEYDRAHIATNPFYWAIDITMPADYLNDFDIIIISGYGVYDISHYNDALRNYLSNGGRLWIDNAGSSTNALTLQNFFLNVAFSTSVNSSGTKSYGITQPTNHDAYSLEVESMNRLYNMNSTSLTIGYPGINPKMVFGTGEDVSLYNKIVQYPNGDPALISRNIFTNGTIIVSNCGILRALLNINADDMKLTMNMLLNIAEAKYVTTPWIQEYVYYRDNLFKEEYKYNDRDAYIDDRNDVDSTQIVAKKILNKTVRDALIPYMPSSYYKANGVFKTEIQADSSIIINNGNFEVGTYSSGAAVTTWNTTTASTIPGWGVQKLTGVATFNHVSNVSERGTKAVQIITTGNSEAFWQTSLGPLTANTYRLSGWIKTQNVSSTTANGAVIAVTKTDGTLIATSTYVNGTQDWVKIDLAFGLTAATSININIGFLDVGIQGTVWFDYITLASLGSVAMTLDGDGSAMLYAYATKAKGDTFDLKGQGFTNADVTVFDPLIEINYTIRAFSYVWDSITSAYIRSYGNYKTYTTKVRRSDGVINLGLLTTLIPGLNAGPIWADKSNVFFEIFLGTIQETSDLSKFINLAFFNPSTGHYFYSKSGENIIGYSDLFNGTDQLNIVVQAWTDYYTIRATKRRYAIKAKLDERIYVTYPSTIDNRDPWYLRVHNGSFTKNQLYFQEQSFAANYINRAFGMHQYALPEFDRQLFKPGKPYRKIRKEITEYVNDNTIRVQNTPLYILSGQARLELMTSVNANNKIFKAVNGNWDKSLIPVVYKDSAGNNIFTPITGRYTVDSVNGIVIFDTTVTDQVKIDYNYNNLEVFKRTYENSKVRRELMVSEDFNTFDSIHTNWLSYPTPVVYRLPYGEANEQQFIVPVDTYIIDYDSGKVTFKNEVHDQVFVDYTYSVDIPLIVKDYDTESGLIYLQSGIDFKDELYVNYYYIENFVHYRGFYDEVLSQFVYLDLNPCEGHYSTLPVLRTDPANGNIAILRYENVPTAKLMNKEVYVYIVPWKDSFGTIRDYTIRHCYSKEEWDYIAKVMPGIAQLVAKVQLREDAKVEDTIVLDTRVRGGGLKESISQEVIRNTDPNGLTFWDIGPWDGQAYYNNGVLVIQLPKTILKINGGLHTDKEITDIIRKYAAFGVYFIIEYI